MGNYKSGDQISRREAWEDLKEDLLVRIWKFNDRHVLTDIFVNLARLAGISDRDTSQDVGRLVMVLSLFGVLGGIGAYFG